MRRVMLATDSASAVFCIRFYSARRRRITHSLLVAFIKKHGAPPDFGDDTMPKF